MGGVMSNPYKKYNTKQWSELPNIYGGVVQMKSMILKD